MLWKDCFILDPFVIVYKHFYVHDLFDPVRGRSVPPSDGRKLRHRGRGEFLEITQLAGSRLRAWPRSTWGQHQGVFRSTCPLLEAGLGMGESKQELPNFTILLS